MFIYVAGRQELESGMEWRPNGSRQLSFVTTSTLRSCCAGDRNKANYVANFDDKLLGIEFDFLQNGPFEVSLEGLIWGERYGFHVTYQMPEVVSILETNGVTEEGFLRSIEEAKEILKLLTSPIFSDCDDRALFMTWKGVWYRTELYTVLNPCNKQREI